MRKFFFLDTFETIMRRIINMWEKVTSFASKWSFSASNTRMKCVKEVVSYVVIERFDVKRTVKFQISNLNNDIYAIFKSVISMIEFIL